MTTNTYADWHKRQPVCDERVKAFVSYRTEHPYLTTSFNETMDTIESAAGPKVLIVTGPTGVGKTTLARRVYKTLVEQHASQMRKDRGFVPVVGVGAVPPNRSQFNWKDFYIRALEQHGDVMLDRKMLIPRQSEIFVDTPRFSPLDRSVADALRRTLESSLRMRGTRVLIIDEAHHMLMVKDPELLEYQFETLKSLTVETKVTLVLVGTYRLLDIRDQSGQLVRRSKIVHFPRYDCRANDGRTDFSSALEKFRQKLPLTVPSFKDDAKYFYVKTGGCVGILKDWLALCTESALKKKMTTFDAEFAEQHAIPNRALRTIIKEALEGEEKVQDIAFDEIADLLNNGLPDETPTDSSPPTRSSRRRRVGERKPVRDKTGGVRHAVPH